MFSKVNLSIGYVVNESNFFSITLYIVKNVKIVTYRLVNIAEAGKEHVTPPLIEFVEQHLLLEVRRS